jgi:phosphate transport system substrate-binding protein
MRISKKISVAALSAALLVSTTQSASAADLIASGSSFANKYMIACKAGTGHNITYSSTGSGTGRSQFTSGTTDFGASDAASALTGTAVGKHMYIPFTGGPVGILYNNPAITGKTLKLDANVLAKIFRGSIVAWDDAAIKELNPTLSLPAKPITVVYRNASSGTSEAFTDYMNKVAPTVWTKAKSSTFTSSAPALPRNKKGAANSQIMVTTVKNTQYSIGYADISDASGVKGLAFAQVKNQNGEFLAPSAASAGKFLDTFTTIASDISGVTVDYTKVVAGGYNLSLFTYAIAPLAGGVKTTGDKAAVKAAVTYLISGCTKGAALGYSTLSGDLKTAALALAAKIG